MKKDTLFVWRWESIGQEIPFVYTNVLRSVTPPIPPRYCKYCGCNLLFFENSGPHTAGVEARCYFCGWEVNHGNYYYEDEEDESYFEFENEKILKQFHIDSSELSFEELGLFIRRKYERVYDLSPRRFELLVADIFSTMGFGVEVTKSSHDGGRDLILFNDGENQAIVEVKRYRNKVGVNLIRQLRGVQLRDDIKKAILVTTSHFTSVAIRESRARNPVQHGFEMNLVDAEDLMKMLRVYDPGAPSLINAFRLRNLESDNKKTKVSFRYTDATQLYWTSRMLALEDKASREE
jgi:hypothetical protein